jgi:hypothetical protein
MSVPNLFILSGTGEVLIEKQWTSKHKRTVCEIFWDETSKLSSRAEVPPIVHTNKFFFLSTWRFGLTFLSVYVAESPPVFIMEFQHLLGDIIAEYFGGDAVNEQSIRENFSILLQLLDEMVDGGFPLTTELTQLKDMILPPSLARRLFANVMSSGDNAGYSASVSQDLPTHAVSKIPWRKHDIKYVTNEIYFDLVENIDAILTPDNNIIQANVYGDVSGNNQRHTPARSGNELQTQSEHHDTMRLAHGLHVCHCFPFDDQVNCNCRLSGMPDLTLTFSQWHRQNRTARSAPLSVPRTGATGGSIARHPPQMPWASYEDCSLFANIQLTCSPLWFCRACLTRFLPFLLLFSQGQSPRRCESAPLRAHQPLPSRESDFVRSPGRRVQIAVLSRDRWRHPDAHLCHSEHHLCTQHRSRARTSGRQALARPRQDRDELGDFHPPPPVDPRCGPDTVHWHGAH